MRQASGCSSRVVALAFVVLAVASPFALGAPAALAAPSTPAHPAGRRAADEQAIALYRESTRAYEEGRFQDAAELLTRAYALRDEPVLLFNLARAYEGMGNLELALDAYRRYLGRDPQASDRRSIEQRIATLQKALDERAALERQRDEERARLEQATREAKMARQQAARAEERRRRPSAVPWAVAGVGVVGIGAGLVLGLVSHASYVDARDEPFKSPAQADYDSARTFATGANIAFVAGGVVAVAGVAWGITDLLGKRSRDATAGAHGGALVLTPKGIGATF